MNMAILCGYEAKHWQEYKKRCFMYDGPPFRCTKGPTLLKCFYIKMESLF